MTNVVWDRAPWWIVAGAALVALAGWEHQALGIAVHHAGILAALLGILFAPLRCTFALLIAMSLLSGDTGLMGAQAILLLRLAARGQLALPANLLSYLLCAFFISAIGSALFGLVAVEMRPLQWFVWALTLGVPLVLLGAARPAIRQDTAHRLLRFVLFCLAVQIPIGALQLYRHGALEPGDWFSGTWEDANMVGLWAACATTVGIIRLVVLPRAVDGLLRPAQAAMLICAALILVWFASAKIVAGSVLVGGAAIIALLWIRGDDISRGRVAKRAALGVVAIAVIAFVARSWMLENVDAFVTNWQDSGKHMLFDRLFGTFDERYNAVVGIGPGMLGSRAANVASPDVLFKEVASVASQLLAPAPKPERWAMRGLWTLELAEAIGSRSALISMPFSGWGSVRAELGWPAVVALCLFLLTLSVRMASLAISDPRTFGFAAAAAVVCMGLNAMLVFDNVLEQPHITAPLIVMAIIARGVHAARATT